MTANGHDIDINININIEARLRDRGLRVTRQRLAVMEYLLGTPDHPTADEVGRAVNARVPRASRASVYNVLQSLRRAGLIEELILEDAVVRYDANLEGHVHFVCRLCRGVEDIPREAALVPSPVSLDGGRLVESVTVTLKGLCAACAGPAGAGGPARAPELRPTRN
ncbi:MAG: Fur family transcriptional regulator [Thermoanaerobaculia bacterium]